MKTYLFTLVLLMSSIALQAQSPAPAFQPRLYVTAFTGPGMNLLKSGGISPYAQGLKTSLTPTANFGSWNTGLQLEWQFAPGLGLSTEAGYSIEGYQFNYSATSDVFSAQDTSNGMLRYEMQTLRLPLFFHGYLPLGKVDLSMFAGPYLNLRMKYTITGVLDQQNIETNDVDDYNPSFINLRPAPRIGFAAGVQAKFPLKFGHIMTRVRAGRDVSPTIWYPAATVSWFSADVGLGIRLF